MKAFHLACVTALGILAGLPDAVAQGAPQRDAPRQEGPREEGPRLDARQTQAAKLAGLAGFVNLDCSALRSDPARLKQAVEAMGLEVAALEQGELLLTANAYIAAYRRDVPGSCRQAEEKFGPSGSVIPGLIGPR